MLESRRHSVLQSDENAHIETSISYWVGGGGNEGAAVSRQVESVGAQLWEVKNLAEGAAVVMTLFAKGLARRLAAPVVVANVNRPSHALRVDSVVAIVLLVWFSSEIQADVLVLQILASLTIAR